MASPSPLQDRKAYFFATIVRCISKVSHWAPTGMVERDNSALFGELHSRFRISLAPLVGATVMVAATTINHALSAYKNCVP